MVNRLDLDAARRRMQDLDAAIVAAIAERVRLARSVAQTKAAQGLPTVDYAQEARVMKRVRAAARADDLDPAVAEAILLRCIEASVTVQESERIRLAAAGEGRHAVVVGGAGRMGSWIVGFLRAQGMAVTVLDPARPDDEAAARTALPDADFVFVAAPPGAIGAIYTDLARDPPRGIVCDVASIKTPFLGALRALADAGGRVASLHPLFGPGARVLRGVDLLVCDAGDATATRACRDLFADTTVRIVEVPLDEHDRWMADVLALAHVTVLAFAAALPDEAHGVRSTTLGGLVDLAWAAVNESPDVYFEIQAENPHAAGATQRLADAVARLRDAARHHDREAFAALMAQGRDAVAAQKEAVP